MDNSQRIRKLFQSALELDESQRAAFLDANCPDTRTRAEVEHLLTHHRLAGTFLSDIAAPLTDVPFERLGGFRLISEIGRGAMGVVYLAEEEKLRRKVALKILMIRLALWERTLQRFHHEARITAKLTHPSIVPIYHFGSEGDYYFIASEYIEGSNLAEELAKVANGDAPLWKDARGAARLLASIADALHHAHQHGVIHRDVKPSNIVIDKKGRGYLTDFGLARDCSEERLTQTGDVAGTYLYMSPEQAAAKFGDIDHRTDIFSLGIVLYEMVCGARPFHGTTSQEILHAISHATPQSLRSRISGLHRDVETLCEKALEKLPEHRFSTAADLAADLRRFAEGDAINARPQTIIQRAIRWTKKSRIAIFAGLSIVSALAGGLWIGFATGTSDKLQVRITSSPAGADVYVRPLVVNSGEYGAPEFIGTTPLTKGIASGNYRLVVTKEGLGFAELTRAVQKNKVSDMGVIHVHAVIRRTSAVTRSMIRIDAGAFVGGIGGVMKQFPRQAYELPAFYVEPYEVTHKDYAQFVSQTGHPAPPSWNPYDADWDELPVVDVLWTDARAYAEWKGMRLPTRLEWDRAACGTNGKRVPWTDDKSTEQIVAACCVGRTPRIDTTDDWFSFFREVACPVGTHPQDRSPAGLFDVVGNVAEWTDTIATSYVDDRIVPDQNVRCVRGYSWRSRPTAIDLTSIMPRPAYARIAMADIGFRCAKSATPSVHTREGE